MSIDDAVLSYSIQRDLAALKPALERAEAAVNTIAATISHVATNAPPSFAESLEKLSSDWAAHKKDLTGGETGFTWATIKVAGATEWALNDAVSTWLGSIAQIPVGYFKGDAKAFGFKANSDGIVKTSGDLADAAATIGKSVHGIIAKTEVELENKNKDLTNQLKTISDELSELAASETPDLDKLQELSDSLKKVTAEKAQTEAEFDAIKSTTASLHSLVGAILEYKDAYPSITALLPVTTSGVDVAVKGLNSLVPIFDDEKAREARIAGLTETFKSLSGGYKAFQLRPRT